MKLLLVVFLLLFVSVNWYLLLKSLIYTNRKGKAEIGWKRHKKLYEENILGLFNSDTFKDFNLLSRRDEILKYWFALCGFNQAYWTLRLGPPNITWKNLHIRSPIILQLSSPPRSYRYNHLFPLLIIVLCF